MKNRGRVCLLLTAYCLLFLLSACGTKTLPSLKAYEKPPAATELSAVHREDKILLTWTYPESLRTNLKGFQVLRSEGQGFEKLSFLSNDKSSFEDIGFKPNNRYRYTVVAKNLKDVLSEDSNIVTVLPRPLPAPPENVRFSIKADSVELSWTGSGEGVCYNIYRTNEKGIYSDAPVNREPVCVVFFKDDKLFPDRPVFYSLRALLNTPIKDEGYASAETEVNSSLFVPSAPSDVRAVRTEAGIYLTWKEAPERWVKGYEVYKKIAGETEFKKLSKVRIPFFTDNAKIAGRVWYAIKALGFSHGSEVVSIEVE